MSGTTKTSEESMTDLLLAQEANQPSLKDILTTTIALVTGFNTSASAINSRLNYFRETLDPSFFKALFLFYCFIRVMYPHKYDPLMENLKMEEEKKALVSSSCDEFASMLEAAISKFCDLKLNVEEDVPQQVSPPQTSPKVVINIFK